MSGAQTAGAAASGSTATGAAATPRPPGRRRRRAPAPAEAARAAPRRCPQRAADRSVAGSRGGGAVAHPRRRWTAREVLDLGLAVSPDFPPGTAFEYSNTNFILLGMVIRRVARKPIGALLRERIIAPLKLNETVWPAGAAALPAPHAHGYTLQGQSSDKPVDATDWTTSAEWTAGELISTVDDLLVYGRATPTGRGLLPRRQQRERLDSLNPRIPPASSTLSYGIGVVNDNGWIGHTATSRASQPPSTTTATSARPSSSRPTAISTAAPAEGERRWRQTRSRGPVRARRIGSWAPSPGALGAPTSFRRDDGDRTLRPGPAPGTVRRGDARVAACLALQAQPRLHGVSGRLRSRRAGRICRWLEEILSATTAPSTGPSSPPPRRSTSSPHHNLTMASLLLARGARRRHGASAGPLNGGAQMARGTCFKAKRPSTQCRHRLAQIVRSSSGQ
jgi:hypothetical protein